MTYLLDYATRFTFPLYPEGHPDESIAEMAIVVERRSDGRWVVTGRLDCYDSDGNTSYHSDLDQFRHSRDEAIRIAREHAVPAERAHWDTLTRRARRSAGEATDG